MSAGFARSGIGLFCDERFDERRVAPIEQFALLIHLEALLANEPARTEFHLGPFARQARLAEQLPSEAATVELRMSEP